MSVNGDKSTIGQFGPTAPTDDPASGSKFSAASPTSFARPSEAATPQNDAGR